MGCDPVRGDRLQYLRDGLKEFQSQYKGSACFDLEQGHKFFYPLYLVECRPFDGFSVMEA